MAWKIYPIDSSDEKKEFGKKIYAINEFNFRHNCYAYMTELIFWQHTDKWRRTRTQSDLSVFFFGFFSVLTCSSFDSASSLLVFCCDVSISSILLVYFSVCNNFFLNTHTRARSLNCFAVCRRSSSSFSLFFFANSVLLLACLFALVGFTCLSGANLMLCCCVHIHTHITY